MISLSAVTLMRLVMLYSNTHVRLTGYNLTHAGRVEVFSNGVWGRVCNVWGSWRQKEAAVVCRQLGFQGVIAALSYPSDLAKYVMMSRVQCAGNERSLQQCQYDDFVNIVPLHSYHEVGVVCKSRNFYSDDGDLPIRLKGSSLPNAGRIEILYAGVWGAISSRNWDVTDATVVCRQLGYRAGAEAALKNRVFGPFIGPIWLTNLQCIGNEKSMMECAHDKIATKTERSPASQFASLICKDGKISGEMKIRLRGSHQPNMGRIEVYFAGRWGAIYPWFGTSSMKNKASTVVCRQLGYRGALLSGDNMFCSEAVLPWFTNLRCNGSETSLKQCDLDLYFNTSVDCMNVFCTNETTNPGFGFRLSGSSAPHAGRVEIEIHGIWGTIGISRFSRFFPFFSVSKILWFLCRWLGYSDGILGTRWMQIGPRRRPIWLLLNCRGKEKDTKDCVSPPQLQLRWPSYHFAQDLGVICKPNVSQINDFQVRLIGTSLPFAGAIEVSYYGVWGGIWGHSIDVRVGHVICRQLGYSGAQQVFRKSVFGSMRSPFLVKGIRCNGNESAISQCTILTIDERNFWDYFDPGYGAGVLCVESQAEISKDFSVRLAGSPISNAGQAEVFYAGVWGTIDSYQWNIKDAHVVCRQLGYRGAISSGASSQFCIGARTVWFSNVSCLGNESSLQECPKSFAGYLGGRRTSTALCKLPYESDFSLSCSDLNCSNSGKCIDSVVGVVCNCTDAFAGLHCQIPLSTPCKSSPCKNGGQCFSNNSSYVCVCPDGLTGKRCEERIFNDPYPSYPRANKTPGVDEGNKTKIHENIFYMKGNAESNSFIMVISVSVIVTLVVTVVCLVFKIRQLTTQQTTRPTNPTKIYRNNTFQAEPVGEPTDEQRTKPTNIDLGSEYAHVDDINTNVRDYTGDVGMSSRPLPPIPSKRTKIYRNNTFQAEPIDESLEEQRTSPTNTDLGSGYAIVDDVNANVRNSEDDVERSSRPPSRIPPKRAKRKGPLIKARERPVNNNPEEPSPETLKMHYMGLQGNDKNKNGAITSANETVSYMRLSPRRPGCDVYAGLSDVSGVAITPKPGVKCGSKTKSHAYARLQKK